MIPEKSVQLQTQACSESHIHFATDFFVQPSYSWFKNDFRCKAGFSLQSEE